MHRLRCSDQYGEAGHSRPYARGPRGARLSGPRGTDRSVSKGGRCEYGLSFPLASSRSDRAWGACKKAGLRAGDVMLSVDGKDAPSVDAIHRILDGNSINEKQRFCSAPGQSHRGTVAPSRRPGFERPVNARRRAQLMKRPTAYAKIFRFFFRSS